MKFDLTKGLILMIRYNQFSTFYIKCKRFIDDIIQILFTKKNLQLSLKNDFTVYLFILEHKAALHFKIPM